MKDQYERNIDYMRISVTDRCNLRCRYCMPEEGIECTRHEDILTFEEIIQVAEAGAGIGIRKIKITGGEPLVRKGIVSLVEALKKVPGIQEVTMTTNGVLLKDMAEGLYRAGLDAVNISLDTLSPMKYFNITRRDRLDEVMLGIEKAYQIGLKTKINCVAMKGFNENEIPMLAAIAMKYKIDVRFIELMPIGLGRNYEYISVKEVQGILEEVYGAGKASNTKHGNGPAVYFNYDGFQGSIGFISAMTNEFCKSCNRIRLTSEGELKLCLNHNHGISLRSVLREHNSGEYNSEEHFVIEHISRGHIAKDQDLKIQLQEIMKEFIYKKPFQHCFHQTDGKDIERRKMVQIGG